MQRVDVPIEGDSRQTSGGDTPVLKVVSVLPAGRAADGRIVVTRKFVEGLAAFKQMWQGPMVVYMPPGAVSSGNLDDVALLPEEFPCQAEVLDRTQFAAAVSKDSRALVLLSLDDFHQGGLAEVCAGNGVPAVFVSEYSLKTRLQIVDATERNPLRRLRRRIWETGEEKRRRRALKLAAGLQANGTPTYDDYRSIQPGACLFFDTRVKGETLATEEQVRARLALGEWPRRLRMLFSGRLTAMKGVMDLVKVASELRRRGVDFELSICGGGDLNGDLERAVEAEKLGDRVKLAGVLDFATGLVPLVKGSVDLFVCCHPQGDPSCTYLETMACGVPIAGYDNDAFAGVVRHSGAGWLAPIGDASGLAAGIERLSRQPQELLEGSLAALRFAREHTFEKSFENRVAHLRAVAERTFKS